mgnify:CR=1 FL=1
MPGLGSGVSGGVVVDVVEQGGRETFGSFPTDRGGPGMPRAQFLGDVVHLGGVFERRDGWKRVEHGVVARQRGVVGCARRKSVVPFGRLTMGSVGGRGAHGMVLKGFVALFAVYENELGLESINGSGKGGRRSFRSPCRFADMVLGVFISQHF